MTKWVLAAAFSAGTVLDTAPALAQQAATAAPRRIYVFSSVGAGGYIPLESGVSEFNGATVAGGVGVFLNDHVFVEGSVDQLAYRRNDWEGWRGKATSVLGRGGYRFGRAVSPVRFLVSGALGHTSDAWHYPQSFTDPRSPESLSSESFGVWGVGVGADCRLKSRIFLRPEFGVLIGDEAYRRGTITVGVRF